MPAATPDPEPNGGRHSLVICMGSACFSRGNARTVPAVQAFLAERGLGDAVSVTGTLCQNRCRQGPNLSVDGECLCGVDPDALPELLEARLPRGPKDPR